MPPRIQFRLADIDLKELQRIEAEVAPSHTQILRDELKQYWLRQIQSFPHPLEINIDGNVTKNRAAVEQEAVQQKLDLAVHYEHQLELLQTQIDVLTEKLTELRREASASPRQDEEAKEASLMLAFWKATSAKPGIFGFSIDLKALVNDTWKILSERSRLIELGLNKPPKKQ